MPDEIDVTKPSAARMYDYALGGINNFAVDRETTEQFYAAWPEVRPLACHNRAFVGRAVRYLTGQGIRQFLDLGSGLPTQDNVHEIAQREKAATRVVYVDNDPVVLAHGRALLDDGSTVLTADLRDTDAVLAHSRDVLDFAQPMGLLATSSLHYIPDPPAEVIRRYVQHLASGSYVAVAHITSDGVAPALQEQAAAVHRGTQHLRTAEEIRAMFCGLELVPPGLVDVEKWRADEQVGPLRVLGGVAVKR